MKSITMTDLIVAGVIMDEVPGLYTRLCDEKVISKTEYKLLGQLWKYAVEHYRHKSSPVMRGNLQRLSVTLEIPMSSLKAAIKQLVDKDGVALLYKDKAVCGLKLSVGIVLNYFATLMAATGKPVQVFETLYPGWWSEVKLLYKGWETDQYIQRRGIKANNLVYKTLSDGQCDCRQPIIGLRRNSMREPIILKARSAIILDNRVPIQLDNRCPIITRAPILLFGNKGKKQHLCINISAPKYDWLTEAQKAELLAIAHMGKKVVEVKLNRFKHQMLAQFTDEELDCLNNLVPYYENLVCSKTGRIEYQLLTNVVKKASPYWSQVWKIYCLCKERGWDYRVYLDSQFEGFANWAASKRYKWPLPSMLYSDRAIAAFEGYIYRNQTAYQREGHNIKVTPKNVGNFREEIAKAIQKAIEAISRDLKHWKHYPMPIFKTVPEKRRHQLEKAKSIVDHWMDSMPVEYLAAVPEILEYIGEPNEYLPTIQAKIAEVEALQNNMAKMRIILPAVKEAELKAGLPVTANLMELQAILND